MSQKDFWNGFGLGALAGAGIGLAAYIAASEASNDYDGHILRIEKSIEIAAPQTEVFRVWEDLEQLPQSVDFIRSVRREGNLSYWDVLLDGRSFRFAAETTRLVPNEAIGWKAVSGTKHSGRIHFARLGNSTVVHVTMNYAPPLGRFGRLLAPVTGHIESIVEQALREFKAAIEGQQTHSARQDHHFQRSNPQQDETGSTRRDLLEAEGSRLEDIRGGHQRVDRRRIEEDRDGIYSPNTQFEYQAKRGPQSAGWDEQDIPSQATGTFGGGTSSSEIAGRAGEGDVGGVDYTRPTEPSYPTGLSEKEQNEK